MRYIGPFFRINTLSLEEISSQLFHFAKESVKLFSLEYKFGISSSTKSYKKNNSIIDITTISNFSPLLCVYKKTSPILIHNKNSTYLDDSSFRKEITPKTNALMTLCILDLIDYYKNFKDIDNRNYSIYEIYKQLTKEQLSFYSEYLRNTEGYFTSKKNTSSDSYKNFVLLDKNKTIDFTDQAYMMLCYYTYSKKFPEEEISPDYESFALEILEMFKAYNHSLYECSFKDLCNILFTFNCFYSISNNSDCKDLLIDLSDYLIYKYNENDYLVNNLDYTSFFSLNLFLAYNNTNIISFLDKHNQIQESLINLYDTNKELIYKLDGKKTTKFTNLDIALYLLAFMYPENEENKPMITAIYKKYIINSGLVSCWPEAPTIDDFERYKKLSLKSEDMLDESVFRMSNLLSPNISGLIPMFYKKISFDKKKEEFSVNNKSSFDTQNNILILFLITHFFKDPTMKLMGFNDKGETTMENLDNEGKSTTDPI